MKAAKPGHQPGSVTEGLPAYPNTRMLEDALAYAASGCHVFPVYEIQDDGSCACGGLPGCSPGKHPRTSNGLSAATRDEKVIRLWWTTWPNANIGIACRPSNRIVLDLDIKPARGNGYVELETIEEKHGRLPYSLRARTGSGGLHIHLAGTSTDYSPFQAIDVRGSGYVLAPPSNHTSGKRYEWLDSDDSRLEAAPDWLLRLLSRPVVTIPEIDPSETLSEPLDSFPVFKESLRRVAAGDSRHNTWVWLALQIRDARLPVSALETYAEPFLAACRRRAGDRDVTSEELVMVARWVYAKTRRDPHPAAEKLLLPDLLEKPVDGDARTALIRRTARILLPALEGSRFGSVDLGVQLLSCVNSARCRPPLTETELAGVVSGVLAQLVKAVRP